MSEAKETSTTEEWRERILVTVDRRLAAIDRRIAAFVYGHETSDAGVAVERRSPKPPPARLQPANP